MHGQAHIPVLADAFVDALFTLPDGRYVDCTFGRGGHTRLLLARLNNAGRIMGLDRDPQAIEEGEKLAAEDARFQIAHTDFAGLAEAMEDAGWADAQGIGFDLGVSSPQFDQAERGFSFQQQGPLDMRMNNADDQPLSAMLRHVSEKELTRVLREYGDERFAGRIAKAILKALHEDKLHTTSDLENACFHAVPKQARHGTTHPATRTFQALRIWVNDEYGQIDRAIRTAMAHLAPGGRLAVISFHSGEDRRVRDLIDEAVNPCTCPSNFPICVCGKTPSMRWVQKKPVRASETEIDANPRSRSALMRVAEKLPARPQ